MIEPTTLPIRDFPPDHPAASDVLKMLRCDAIERVKREGAAKRGFCYWNVQRECERAGGTLELGWMITWLPGIYIEAMHHGVWRKPKGELVDPTLPSNSSGVQGYTTFVRDDRLRVDLAFPVLIENRHLLLVDDPIVQDWLREYRRKNSAAQSLCAELKRIGGYSWSPELGMLGPPLPGSAKRYAGKIRRSNAELQRLKNALSAMHGQMSAVA